MPYASKDKRRACHAAWVKKNPTDVKEASKRYRVAHPERLKENHKRWRSANLEKQLLSAAKMRAKKKGMPFDLEIWEIAIPTFCPYFGLRLERASGRVKDNSPTLDRIYPKRGYVTGNIEVISWRANRLKGDGTAEEHRQIAERMTRLANPS
jgi:hypothetical protein